MSSSYSLVAFQLLASGIQLCALFHPLRPLLRIAVPPRSTTTTNAVTIVVSILLTCLSACLCVILSVYRLVVFTLNSN